MEIEREMIAATDDEIEAAFDELGYGITIRDLLFAPASEMGASWSRHDR